MKTNWQTKKLSDVCFFQEGPGIRKYEYKKNGYPIINVRCVQDGYIDLLNAQAVDPKFIKEKWAHFQVEEGDILFTTSGTIGRTAMATKDDLPLLMNTSVVRFKSLDEKELDRYFLAWLLRSPKFIEEVKSYSSGTAQKNVGPTHLKLISISYPPLSEQKRIVKILDEAFEKIEKAKGNAEKNLKNSKELFESYLQNVFANPGRDWEEKKLGDIGKVSMCKRVFKDETARTGDIPFYKIGTFGKEPDAFISNERYNEFRKKYSFPKKGDILISASGTIGRRVRYDGEPAYFQDSNIVWIDNDEKQVLNDYLYSFYGACDWNATKGATISRLYNDNLRQIKIAFPKSISEQKMIIKKIDLLSEQTEKLENVYNKKLVDLEELKKSVLNKAFSGEL